MDYSKIEELLNKLLLVYQKYDEEAFLTIAAPAAQDEIEEVEQKIGIAIPMVLKRFFMEFSKECIFCSNFWKKLALPPEFSGIFSAYINLSLNEIALAEKSRSGWQEVCFPDENDEYDRLWHNKLGFMTVKNGDIIALDIAADPVDPPVVYLSHDDGEGHGYILGRTLGEYITNLLMVGACGSEDWQMLPFCNDSESGIDPHCENSRAYRKLIGYEI